MGACAQLRTGRKLRREQSGRFSAPAPSAHQSPGLLLPYSSEDYGGVEVGGGVWEHSTCEPALVSAGAWCPAQLCHVVWVGQGPGCGEAAGWLRRAGVRGALPGRDLPGGKTSLGSLVPSRYMGLGWVLEMEKELAEKLRAWESKRLS